MDAPALCDSILQFVGGGLPAQTSGTSSVPMVDLADGAAGERVCEDDTSGDTTAGSADRTGSTAVSAATEQQQRLQKQGLMQAFMGSKASFV